MEEYFKSLPKDTERFPDFIRQALKSGVFKRGDVPSTYKLRLGLGLL